MSPSPAPALLDSIAERAVAAARAWSPDTTLSGVRPLTGGASSLTFVADLSNAPAMATGTGETGDAQVVLKVAPPGLAPVRNRDVLRQAKLQGALADQPGVLVPAPLFSDAGNPPEIPPFFAMTMVAGECVEPVLAPVNERPEPSDVRARNFDAMKVLAAVHRVVPASVGLGDEPVVTLAEEIDRWTRAFGTVSDELRGNYLECHERLHATIPPAMAPVVNHGDYRLGNTLCSGDRLTAIIDWEIWSVGDPRVDLSWFTFFLDEAEHPAAEPGSLAGTPTRKEVLDVYQEAFGAELADMAWFEALTKYKESAATALLLKRALKAGGELSTSNTRMLPALATMREEVLEILAR